MNSINRKKFLLSIFLLPISISGIATNYSFALLFIKSKFNFNVPVWIKLYFFYCFISYFLGNIVFFDQTSDYLLRATVSFILYLLPLSILFLKLNFSLDQLKSALILVGVLYSILVIYTVITQNVISANPYFLKKYLRDYVPDWPQRFSTILVFSFFITLNYFERNRTFLAAFSLLIIFFALYLTYTRAAYLAVAVGSIIYFFKKDIKKILLCFSLMSIAIGYYFFINHGIDLIFNAFQQVFSHLLEPSSISEKSAATRLIYWKAILNVLKNNPLTGTGFGGIYLFYREIGSAHSEYMDILLRTGLIGFAFYLFLWYKLLTFYKKIDLAIYSACWGIFIFGLFQETTKLPYMAFVFFTLFNFTLLPMQNNDFIQHN